MQRLISYNHKGLRQWGVLTQDSKSIIPAELLEETYFIPLGETMDEFIETGDEGLLNLAKVMELNIVDQERTTSPMSRNSKKIQMRKIRCIPFFLQKQPLLSSVQMKKLIFIGM